MKSDIRSRLRDELEARFKDWGVPGYRVEQLLEWLYSHRAHTWGEMSNLPAALRERLAAEFSLINLELVRKQGARDTTRKFLWRLPDGAMIESVLIPASPSLYCETSDRRTLCVSTQVGCAYGCKFCASGLDGWKRNLGAEEIVGQILAVERLGAGESPPSSSSPNDAGAAPSEAAPSTKTTTRTITNLVFMGMGERWPTMTACFRPCAS